MNKHRNGGVISGISCRVAKLPTNPSKEQIMQAVRGVIVTLRIPRRIAVALIAQLEQTRKAVVVVGRTGKLKVYSLDGYRAAQYNAIKNRPWDSSKNKELVHAS